MDTPDDERLALRSSAERWEQREPGEEEEGQLQGGASADHYYAHMHGEEQQEQQQQQQAHGDGGAQPPSAAHVQPGSHGGRRRRSGSSSSSSSRERDRDGRHRDRRRERETRFGADRDRDARAPRRSRSRSRDKARRSRSRERSRDRSRDRHKSRRREEGEVVPRRRSRTRSRSRSRERRRHRGRSRSRSRDRRRSRSRQRRWSRGRSVSPDARVLASGAPWRRASSHRDDGDDDGDDRHHSSWRRRERDSRHVSDSDGGRDNWREGSGGARGGRDTQTSSTLHVRGLPDEAQEADLLAAMAGWPVVAVRIARRDAPAGGSSSSKGYGFVDFPSEDDAARFLASRPAVTLPGAARPLDFNYALPGSAASDAPSLMDWVCDRCGSVNFSRRLECYQCSCVRPAAPRRVPAAESEAPSNVLKVSNLEDGCTEAALSHFFALAHVGSPVLDVRLVRDKFTAAPRGFAYVEFGSVADATRAMHALQGTIPEGHGAPVRICYARSRGATTAAAAAAGAAGGPPAGAVDLGPRDEGAAVAFLAEQAFSGWAPKEYTEEEGNEQQEDQQQQQPAAANDASASQPLAASHHADDDAAAAAQAPDASQQGWNAGNSDYVYDEATGYWYVASTGAYYDSTTGLYFLPDVGTWHNLDPGTGQYVPVASEGQQQQPGQGQGQQGGGAVVEGGAAAAGQQQQQQQQPRRRGAVIGAAPQYNPHGLLLAAQALEVPKATSSRPGAKASGQQSQQGAKAAAAGRSTAAAPGLGSQPTRPAQGAVSQGAAAAAASVGSKAPQPAGAAAAAAGGAAVQGIIYRGKWSQRQAS